MRKTVLAVAAAVLVAAAAPAASSALDVEFRVAGEGEGKLKPRDGGYRLKGTFHDQISGQKAQVRGTLTEVTTGFTTCPLLWVGVILCQTQPEQYRCNILEGEVTFRRGETRATATLVTFGPIGPRRHSSICLTDTPGVLSFQVYVQDLALGPVYSFGSVNGIARSRGKKFDVSFTHPLGAGAGPGIEYHTLLPS